MSTQVANEPATLTEAILGKELITSPLFSKVRAWPAELRAALFSVLLASAVLLPYLGAVGLWDPWEVHYGEVAREMIERNDYIHPFSYDVPVSARQQRNGSTITRYPQGD